MADDYKPSYEDVMDMLIGPEILVHTEQVRQTVEKGLDQQTEAMAKVARVAPEVINIMPIIHLLAAQQYITMVTLRIVAEQDGTLTRRALSHARRWLDNRRDSLSAEISKFWEEFTP